MTQTLSPAPKSLVKELLPFAIIFIILQLVLQFLPASVAAKGIDTGVLTIANILMLGLSILSFLLTRKNLKSSNPHAFTRGIYTGFMLKFFALIIAAVAYFTSVEHVDKSTLFLCMGVYAIYAMAEVISLQNMLKKK